MKAIVDFCTTNPSVVVIVFFLLIFIIIILIKNKYTVTIGKLSFVPKEDKDCCKHRKCLIEKMFLLFNTSLGYMTSQGVIFRLNYLVYDTKKDHLKMYVQDGAYEDSSFSINVREGELQDIKVCKAIRANRIIMENLTKNHTIKYPDSPIPKTLRSVIAFPISINEKIIGAVALDCSEKIEDIGMDKENIKNYFLHLCNFIGEIESK